MKHLSLSGFIQRYAYAAWLGGALAAAGWQWNMWQLYAVLIPFFLLLMWRDIAMFENDPT